METTQPPAPTVDVAVPRFNQAVIAVITGAAFLADLPWLVALAFLILAVSSLGGTRFAPLTRLYVGMIGPRLRPDGPRAFEDARPPRFAQLIGMVFLGAATAAFALGAPTAGWVLTLTVAALAALAATTAICVGCILYERAIAR
jgi:hypothetical protein